jgi:hypothetical protein
VDVDNENEIFDDEELEEEQHDDATPDDHDDAGADDQDSDAPAPKNGWNAALDAIRGEFDTARDGESTDKSGKPDGEDEADDDKKDQEKDGKKPDAAADKPSRYTIADSQGDKYELELPEGATIRYKADGREVEVKSFDELVAKAQKGEAFDRVAQQRTEAVSRAESLEGNIEQQRVDFEETLLKICFDKEAFKAVRKAISPFRDPNVRELTRKAQAHDKRSAQDAEDQESGRSEAVQQFWERVETTIDDSVGGDDFPLLDAEDKPEIVQKFYGLIEKEFDRVYTELKAANKGGKVSDERLKAAAEQEALKVATGANLKQVMQDVHSRYQRKAGGKKPDAQGKGKGEQKRGRRDVADHNQRVESKIDQRNRNRGIKRGAPPSSVRDVLKDRPKSFSGTMSAIKKEFDRVR